MNFYRRTEIKILDKSACFIISCASDLGMQSSHEHYCNDTGKGNKENEAKISSWTYPSVISQSGFISKAEAVTRDLTRGGFFNVGTPALPR